MVLAVVVVLAATGHALSPSPVVGATSSTVVTMEVPSATTFVDGCQAVAAVSLGIVQPDTPATTATGAQVCRFTFGSSNDTAMLRLSQYDSSGTAMVDDEPNWATTVSDSEPQRGLSIVPGLSSRAFIVNGWGGSRSTSDSGATWPGGGGMGSGCNSVSANTTNDAWAGCDVGTIYKTTNGGTSWSLTNATGATGRVMSIDSINSSSAMFVTFDGELRYTTDGGGTWQAPTTPPPGGTYFNKVDMVNASTAYMLRHSNTVYKTTNGGDTWSSISTGASGSCKSIDAPSALVVWAACDGGDVRRSVDGATFADASTSSYMPMRDIAAVDANTAVAVGWQGEMQRTTDGGSSWTRVGGDITAEDLVAIEREGTRMYAIGAGGLVISSNDTGQTWVRQRVRANGERLNAVAMVDADLAWAVGDAGKIRRTDDGGATWANQASGTTAILRGVTALSPTVAVAVGEAGSIVRTTNGGTTWAPVASGTTTRLNAVSGDSGRYLLAAGDGGVVLRSDDAGVTWTTVRTAASGTDDLNDIAWANPGEAWLVGDDETLEQSTDGGRTWTARTIPVATPGEAFVRIAVSGDGESVVVGPWNYGEIYVTRNGGTTWTNPPGSSILNQTTDVTWHGSSVITTASVTALASSGDDFATSSYDENFWLMIGGYDALDTSRAIAVGEGGTIHRQLPAGTISDYGGGNTWGSASTTSMFGVCLQQIGGSSLADWTVDPSTSCQALDSDPWRAVPTTPDTVAHTGGSAQTGTADLVFGLRPAEATPPGRYRAKVRVEVIAPWVP
ncbi:MAG: hypothetical protein KDC46_03730 [Thermoleophilia bacterium]|nr:hypothetical protein [Thermoleophilia bacterium]